MVNEMNIENQLQMNCGYNWIHMFGWGNNMGNDQSHLEVYE